MQASSVVCVVDLDLVLFSQLESQHVSRKVKLGFGLVEVCFVDIITEDLGCICCQHEERVILNT